MGLKSRKQFFWSRLRDCQKNLMAAAIARTMCQASRADTQAAKVTNMPDITCMTLENNPQFQLVLSAQDNQNLRPLESTAGRMLLGHLQDHL